MDEDQERRLYIWSPLFLATGAIAGTEPAMVAPLLATASVMVGLQGAISYVLAHPEQEQDDSTLVYDEWLEASYPVPSFASPLAGHRSRVLIVDDDIDQALAMQSALDKLGCQTDIVTTAEEAHRKISLDQPDIIFLDWMLDNKATAAQVLEASTTFIGGFADLREKFSEHPPRIITHSVLNREQIRWPDLGEHYFDHVDHWQKPLPFQEIIARATGLLSHC